MAFVRGCMMNANYGNGGIKSIKFEQKEARDKTQNFIIKKENWETLNHS